MAGRKTKLTPEVQERMVQALGVGATHRLACQYAGIAVASFTLWMSKGEKGLAPYAAFSAAIKRAEARAIIGWLSQIEEAARAGTWQAAAWKLSHLYPQYYGLRRAEAAVTPALDIQVHVQTARERLQVRVEGLATRQAEDMRADASHASELQVRARSPGA